MSFKESKWYLRWPYSFYINFVGVLNMKYECRYDPKYASQYKSKHTKHVKLSKKVLFPLDTQK
jgi:hypothetical protein